MCNLQMCVPGSALEIKGRLFLKYSLFFFFFALKSVSAYRKLSKLRAACFGQGHAKGLGSSPRDISLAIIKHLLTSVCL